MPLVIELSPRQIVTFRENRGRTRPNGFEVEPMGPKSVAIQAVPGCYRSGCGKIAHGILDGLDRENAAIPPKLCRRKSQPRPACHAAIKINMPLEQSKMEWLLDSPWPRPIVR